MTFMSNDGPKLPLDCLQFDVRFATLMHGVRRIDYQNSSPAADAITVAACHDGNLDEHMERIHFNLEVNYFRLAGRMA